MELSVGNGSNNVSRLLVAALEHEPSWGLGQVHDESHDEEAEGDLERQGETPARRSVGRKVHAVVDPVRDHDAEGDEGALNHDKLASLVSRARLGLPHGHGRGVASVSEAGDDSSDDEVVKRKGRGLKGGSDDHDAGAEHDHLSAAEPVADEDGDDGADEAAEVV